MTVIRYPLQGKPLTPPELQVLRLVACGLSNARIAEETSLTVDSVKSHLARLRAKLGARDRAHAVGIGYRAGLLGDRPVISGGRWAS